MDQLEIDALLIAASLLIGVFAVWKLPREEEPQIIVPMVDVFVEMPDVSGREVEERVTKPMEKLLWESPGVEYVVVIAMVKVHGSPQRAFWFLSYDPRHRPNSRSDSVE